MFSDVLKQIFWMHLLVFQIVMCDHRRVKTAAVRKWFPEPLSIGTVLIAY